MNLNRDRLHTIGWGTAMAICLALTAVLTTRVNAVKSQVALADRQIAQLTREKLYLETEFETRANALTGEVAGGMPKPALKVASLNDRLSRLDRSARGATVGPASGGFGGERE